ncbi:hypothetical protein BDR22DRAFT_824559 [Usnea florida]
MCMFDGGDCYLSPPWWMPFRNFVGYWMGVVIGRWIGGLLGYQPFFPELWDRERGAKREGIAGEGEWGIEEWRERTKVLNVTTDRLVVMNGNGVFGMEESAEDSYGLKKGLREDDKSYIGRCL